MNSRNKSPRQRRRPAAGAVFCPAGAAEWQRHGSTRFPCAIGALPDIRWHACPGLPIGPNAPHQGILGSPQ